MVGISTEESCHGSALTPVWKPPMRTGVSYTVSPADYQRLTAIVKNPNLPQKHVWRADIVRALANRGP